MKEKSTPSSRHTPYSQMHTKLPPRPVTARGQAVTAQLYVGGALDSQVSDSQYIRCITVPDSDEDTTALTNHDSGDTHIHPVAADITPHDFTEDHTHVNNDEPGGDSQWDCMEGSNSGYYENQGDLLDKVTAVNIDDPGSTPDKMVSTNPQEVDGHFRLTDSECEVIQSLRRHVEAQVKSLTKRQSELEAECQQLRVELEVARLRNKNIDSCIGQVQDILQTCTK